MSNINPDFEWLYPDLLQHGDLIKALKKRFIRKDDLHKLEKNELVELYHKYIIPLPQRKYRQNRRGRQMTKQQVLLAKKRRHSTADDNTEPPKKKQSAGGLVTSYEHLKGAGGDRLKPPPSCVNFEKKTVKLGSSSSSSSTSPQLSSSLNKLSLIRDKPKSDSKADSPEKKVKLNDTDQKIAKSELKANTIKLINKQMERQSDSAANEKLVEESKNKSVEVIEKATETNAKISSSPTPMDTSESEPKEKQKKKIKITRISWP